MSTILVPLDGAGLAERAVPLAVTLARSTGAGLRLFEALGLPLQTSLTDAPMAGFDELEAGCASYLKEFGERVAPAFRCEGFVCCRSRTARRDDRP